MTPPRPGALPALLLMAACLSPAAAEIRRGSQTIVGFSAFQCPPGAADGYFAPVHVRLEENCTVSIGSTAQLPLPSPSAVAIVVWDEAVAAGCFSFAQVAQRLVAATPPANTTIRAAVFGSAVGRRDARFGSPIVEPYDDLQAAVAGLLVMMTAAPDARALAATPPGALLYLRSEPGPWNSLVYSAGFKVHRYLFVAVPVLLIIYSLWEIGLMLCTLTVWNWRMLIYISVIAYLVLFTLLQPYSMNSRAATMAIHVSWIAGYLCLSLFIVAWSAMVRKIHGDGIALRYHQIAHYCIAAVVALTLLVKLWAFAAQSYRLYTITTDVATYGIPAMLGTQTALLGMVVWSFLRCAFTIAISNHMRSVLKNMAALCVISLSGCLCMVVQGLLLATPASFRTGGYHAVSVLYHLGQCLLCIATLGVLWVKDHAKRTRPLLGQLEFRADGVTCTQHQLAPQRAQAPLEITALPRVPLSDGLSRGFQPDPIISISCA